MTPGKKPLRILHLITSLNVGGAQMHLFKTISRFDPEKISSLVVSLLPSGQVRQLIQGKANSGVEIWAWVGAA